MPVPDETLGNFRKRMMKYPDAMAFMWTELQSNVKDGAGRFLPLLRPESSSYWSEQSERVTIIGWAAVIGVDKEIRRRWGRWKPSVDEDYVTTTRKMVHTAQKEVAGRIRRQHGTLDVVDDRSVVNNFTVWLQDVHRKTVSEANLEGQCIAPDHWGSPPKVVSLKSTSERAASEGYVPTSPTSNLDIAEDSPTEIFEEEEHADLPEAEPNYPLGTYVLAIVGRGKRRTLHVSGGCHRLPGVHFKEFVIVGMERPELDPAQGERLCSTCFSTREKTAEAIQAGADGHVATVLNGHGQRRGRRALDCWIGVSKYSSEGWMGESPTR